MPFKELFEKYPLYRKLRTEVESSLRKLSFPTVNLYCDVCESEETFTVNAKYGDAVDILRAAQTFTNDLSSIASPSTGGEIILLEYRCAGCNDFKRFFLVKISEDLKYIMKVGQFPPWDTTPEKNVLKMLKEHKSIFKKGLICESQSYGIGAYAYYRRIVELIIDELLDSIRDLLDEKDKKDYEEALSKTKKTKKTAEKIELVKDILPKRLRPGNVNPLATLHEKLSKGIHEKSDEECIEDAETVRTILIYLVDQVIESRESSKQFTESMKKILDKKNKS